MISELLSNDLFDSVALKLFFFFSEDTLIVNTQISVCVHVHAHVNTCA